jgi:hypothetical protein
MKQEQMFKFNFLSLSLSFASNEVVDDFKCAYFFMQISKYVRASYDYERVVEAVYTKRNEK